MIGIDISDRSVKVVRLSNDASHRFMAHGAQDIPEKVIENGMINNLKTVQEIIRKTLDICKIIGHYSDPVIASIPEAQSFLRVIEIPLMNDDEIGEAVQWEVAQHIPFGLENVYLDWQPLSGGHKAASGRREVLVGATPKKVVTNLYDTLHALGLEVAAFELESQAIVRALISADLRGRQGILIIDLGASGTNVVIHDHGALRFTATLQKGVNNIRAGLSTADATVVDTRLQELSTQDAKRLGTQMLPAMEELVMEIRGIVEFYNSIDAEHEVKEIILTGGGSNLPGLDQAFLRYFANVHVQRGSPWVNILTGHKTATAPLNLQESVRYTTALGLALRSVIR